MKATARDDGFSLVEVIIAMVLLLIIAVSLLPALVDGVRYSSEQSAVATATRHLNGLIEQARDDPTCGKIDALSAELEFNSDTEREMTSSGEHTACVAKSTVTLTLVARDAEGDRIATAEAVIYIPEG